MTNIIQVANVKKSAMALNAIEASDDKIATVAVLITTLLSKYEGKEEVVQNKFMGEAFNKTNNFAMFETGFKAGALPEAWATLYHLIAEQMGVVIVTADQVPNAPESKNHSFHMLGKPTSILATCTLYVHYYNKLKAKDIKSDEYKAEFAKTMIEAFASVEEVSAKSIISRGKALTKKLTA